MSNLEAIIVKSTKELLGMANVRKHDCESVCKDRGLNYLREQNPYVWVLDDFGFTHRFDRSSFVRGSSPSPKSIVGNKTEYSICMIKSKHPEIEDYIDFTGYEYTTALAYTQVVCKKHGAYRTKPNWIMNRGHHCMQCAEEIRTQHKNLGTQEFISRSKKYFGDTYDYSKVQYKDCRTHVTIGCRTHGDFSIVAYCHSNGSQGCQKCGKDSERSYYSEKHINGSSVYLVKLESANVTYYKIGLSSNVNKRMVELSRESGCKVSIVKRIHFKDSSEAWDTESLLLDEFKDSTYAPDNIFRGYTECFKFTDIENVVKVIDIIC